MKTVQIEKESIHNRIIGNDGKERSPKPFVAQFVLKKEGKETKVRKDYLRPTTTEYLGDKDGPPEDNQRRYTWDAPQHTPLSIGSCVSYNEFETLDGMFIDGQWQEMSFYDIRKHLLEEAARDADKKASKGKKAKEDSIAEDPFEGHS